MKEMKKATSTRSCFAMLRTLHGIIDAFGTRPGIHSPSTAVANVAGKSPVLTPFDNAPCLHAIGVLFDRHMNTVC